ncbi:MULTISPECIES: NAD-dependent epimerase/dehydratase family protein [Acinetobacter]|uniref:NAD-dependent epimerase/dehydratase family protein n=1 Tax=Acinetobacter TaxID=469 RepID=UPI00019AE1BA|nr:MULTISPECIES: NAD-dependent epimerase/dehydratase family protein [Acinetobacter]EEH67722.1 NAD dependent epimerase/dehydratase family protein [Acinetobacter sp. ATCC 27244]NAR56823.1 NAD(P)H-binding protein [Acinetobacter haemolyticus]NAR59313.1 NAD(P)H-binding protein [Acinetobacter haemolyticus]NAR66014.1 NAD(P)H-binding protein [Acinetobacter haemolyticus]NAR69132.1 NAD(P)H-binding protein [Acinetobacter haemolyticus]
MHILFIGYGKTSQRVAKHLFERGHHISTISRTPKTDCYATHYTQDVHCLDVTDLAPIDVVYVILAPSQSGLDAYQHTYVDSIKPIVQVLASHPVKRIVIVSSTRVYGQNAGERVDDDSEIQPVDEQGHLLRKMELLWQSYYPLQSIIVRPTGIYGISIARLKRLAEQTLSYPNLHFSNRIHIDDLAKFLALLIDLPHVEASYIVSNNQPLPMHEILQWFQQQLGLPLLKLLTEQQTGKRIYATRLMQTGFKFDHLICFNDYAAALSAHSNAEKLD